MRFDPQLLKKCWFLAGPTACGKSDLALSLASQLGAEIISLDSMSLYRGMDVGTAKPSWEMRRTVAHHLIDILEPYEEYSLADYVQAADSCCRDVVNRKKTPIFVGGTGLYLRGVLRGVFEGPPADWEFRRKLAEEAKNDGREALYDRLRSVDPVAAAHLSPRDVRRVTRALEVHHLTGLRLSEMQRESPLPAEDRPRHVYWLDPPRDWLYDRINRRVEAMFAEGLADEVRRLLALERPLSRTARQALGYKEVIDALESGLPPESTIDLIQRRTRQFAKRQHTWFRNLEECTAIPITGDASPNELAERLLAIAAEADRM